jgi:hypothetical protein
MRKLSNMAFAVAVGLSFFSILFVAVASGHGSFAQEVCKLGGSLCHRPSLLLIPIAVTLAWALMLRTIRD